MHEAAKGMGISQRPPRRRHLRSFAETTSILALLRGLENVCTRRHVLGKDRTLQLDTRGSIYQLITGAPMEVWRGATGLREGRGASHGRSILL